MHFFHEVFTEDQLVDFLEVLTHAEASERLAEMPWVPELRAIAAAAAKTKTDAERKAKDGAIAQAAAKEKRRLEIEELRRQGQRKTHEEVERE